jgi:hypothetical protein
MTTSGVITSTMTTREVLTRAFRQSKIIASGEVPTSDEMETGVTVLNLMLKSWQADGCNLWRETSGTITATGATTTLSPRCLDVLEARLVTAHDRPLTRWEWGEYVSIPNKAVVGNPSCFVFRRQRDTATLTLWPVPVSARIDYTYARVVDDVTDDLDLTLDVPQEWLECVVTNMAVRLAEEFGAEISPTVFQRAEMLLTQMRDLDRPSSIFMGAC